MKVLTPEEVEERFGLTAEQVEELERDAANGVLHGEPRGNIVRGRPFMFGEEMRQVGFKEPLHIVNAIGRRAEELGMRRSDYLRALVEADLAEGERTGGGPEEGRAPAPVAKKLRGRAASDFWERWNKRAIFGPTRDSGHRALAPKNVKEDVSHARSAR